MVYRLQIIDPSIINHTGHYAEYALALSEAAVAFGIKACVLSHQDIEPELVRPLNALPAFRYSFWDRFIENRYLAFGIDTLIANWHFYFDLCRFLRIAPEERTIVFVPTCNHRQLFAWAFWVIRRLIPPSICLVLLFRYSYYDLKGWPRWDLNSLLAGIGFWMIQLSAHLKGVRIRLATDSTRLAAEYKKLTRMPLEIFPIPHTDHMDRCARRNSKIKQDTICFVSLGDIRKEKGFPLIAKAIHRLNECQLIDRVEFLLQANISSEVHSAMAAPRQQLIAMDHPNVNLIEGPLSRKEYAALIEKADVILLPYSRRVYLSRTSGPFTEALAAGKPVIVTDDTWMSEQLAEQGAGITIRDANCEDLVQAIIRIRNDFEYYSEKALLGAAKWKDFHNPKTLIKCLASF